MFNFGMPKNWFAVLRNAEGGEGGGAGGGGSTGPAAGAEGGAAAAGDGAPPATTFLGEAAAAAAGEKVADPAVPAVAVEGETKAAEGAASVPAFDLAAVTLAEGFTLAEETGKAFSDLLANADLSPQERGQQLIDLHQTAVQDAVKAVTEKMTADSAETWTNINNEWRTSVAQLPEFKSNPEAEGGKVMQALLSVGADEKFFQAMDLTGAGNNPAVMQVLHRLAQPFLEGGAVNGNGKTVSARRLGDNIYTSANKS